MFLVVSWDYQKFIPSKWQGLFFFLKKKKNYHCFLYIWKLIHTRFTTPWNNLGKPRRWYHGKLLEGNDEVLHPINPGQGLSNFQEKSTSKCNITAPYFLISTWLLLMLFYCYNIIVQFLARLPPSNCFPVCNQTNVSSWICCVMTLCTSIHCCYFIFKISEFSHHFIQITPDVKTAHWNNVTLTVRNCLSQHGARPDVITSNRRQRAVLLWRAMTGNAFVFQSMWLCAERAVDCQCFSSGSVCLCGYSRALNNFFFSISSKSCFRLLL